MLFCKTLFDTKFVRNAHMIWNLLVPSFSHVTDLNFFQVNRKTAVMPLSILSIPLRLLADVKPEQVFADLI